MSRTTRPPMPMLPRLLQAALLSAVLLFAQQGAIRHEWTHHAVGAQRDADARRAAAAERCDLCLGFAQLASAVASDVFAPTLLGGIAFALSAPLPVAARDAEPLAARSRGPPRGA